MLKILVVDDSMIMRRTIKVILEELGHKVIGEASSGQDAIKKYKIFNPNLVTMDIVMPNMTGIEAVRALKAINNDVKIIMVTSIGEETKVMDAIIAGAKGYILKPIAKENVKKSILKVFPPNDDVLGKVFNDLYNEEYEDTN
jgi:two-component system chemotaxis response regulator CheY